MSVLFKAQLGILLQETKSILTDRVGFFPGSLRLWWDEVELERGYLSQQKQCEQSVEWENSDYKICDILY